MHIGTFIVCVSFLACSTAEKSIDTCPNGDPDCLASEHVSLLQSKLSYLPLEKEQDVSDADQADSSRPVCTGDACDSIQITRCSNTETCRWRIERGSYSGNEEARIRLPQAGRLKDRQVDIASEHDRLQLNGLSFDEVRIAAHYPAGGVMTVMDNDVIVWMSHGWDQRSDVNSGWMLEYTPPGSAPEATTPPHDDTTVPQTTAASTTTRSYDETTTVDWIAPAHTTT